MSKQTDALPKAIAAGELMIGELIVPCAVLEDGRRVLTETGMQVAIGMSAGGAKDGLRPLARFAAVLTERGRATPALTERAASPISFSLKTGGRPARGYEASILAEVCEAVLQARADGLLTAQQMHVADRCELLMRGFARVGLVALIDEATGYQAIRARNALEQILEAFIAKELHSWVKTFPDEYYVLIYKLNRWRGDPLKADRPGIIGGWTNDIVYERLAPGVLAELQRLTPRGEDGRLTQKLHQRLTREIGHPKLKTHIDILMALMRASTNWGEFVDLLNRSMPKTGVTIPLPLPRTRPEDDAP